MSMDWDGMRKQWRREPAMAPLISVEALQELDRKLRRQVRSRDRWELIAAVLVAPIFLLVAIDAAVGHNWPACGFALLLVAFAVWAPLRFRAARRKMSEPPRE